MKTHQIWRNITIFLITLLLLFCSVIPVSAAEKKPVLTVCFSEEGIGFSQVGFRLYHIAERSDTGQFILTEDFARYPVILDGLDSSEKRALAQTLEAYISRDDIMPEEECQTDEAGKVQFHLKTDGLYLVVGDQCVRNGEIYTPESFLVSFSEEDNYDIISYCKFDKKPISSETGKETQTVRKIWDDAGHEETRPGEIEVQLLKDETIYDTVTLNEENDWEYKWEGLDTNSKWQVTENSIPEDYTVSIEKDESISVITNTYRSAQSGGTETGGSGISENPGTVEGLDPSNEPPSLENLDIPKTDQEEQVISEGSKISDTNGIKNGEETVISEQENVKLGDEQLPQTGMLWWPVPVLAFTGLLLFLVGWRKYRERT